MTKATFGLHDAMGLTLAAIRSKQSPPCSECGRTIDQHGSDHNFRLRGPAGWQAHTCWECGQGTFRTYTCNRCSEEVCETHLKRHEALCWTAVRA